jgi:hypothetical protein
MTVVAQGASAPTRRHCHLPLRNPHFTGRHHFLEELHNDLTRPGSFVRPHVLYGGAGVGKTQIAAEYAYRHRHHYDVVWWVPADDPDEIRNALLTLSRRLGFTENRDAKASTQALREWLAGVDKHWLLIFDNVGDYRDVEGCIPSGGSGRILITSRNPHWKQCARTREVDTFSRDESVEFLRNSVPATTVGEAERLAGTLGDLPLALEQASAWRTKTGMPAGEYLGLFAAHAVEILGEDAPPSHRASVRDTFGRQLAEFADDKPAALQLLRTFAFFAPEPIPRALLIGLPPDDFAGTLVLRDVVEAGLIRHDVRNDAYAMHRLVQLMVNEGMDESERVQARDLAHLLLANAKRELPAQRDGWAFYAALHTHVKASGAIGSADPTVHDLVFDLIQQLYHSGEHQAGEQLAEQAHHHRIGDLGPNHPHTLRTAKWLAWMRQVNGNFDRARELNTQTLDLHREALGDADEETIDAKLAVGVDLRIAGDFATALDLDRTAAAEARNTFNPDHALTLRAENNVAVGLRLAGHFAEAVRLDEDTLRRRRIELGEDHSATTLSRLNLLQGQCEAGDHLAAREALESVLSRSIAIFGPEAPLTVRTRRALAVARRRAGDHAGALELSGETLDVCRRRYGDDHPETVFAAHNHAIDRRHDGDLKGARELAEQTLDRLSRLFGARHPYTLATRTNLAVVLRHAGAFADALAHDRNALADFQEVLGADHPHTLLCAINLANDLSATGQAEEAHTRDADTVVRLERVLGADHPSTLAGRVNLALDLVELGQNTEADQILASALAGLHRALNERHPAALNAQQSLRADCDIDVIPL